MTTVEGPTVVDAAALLPVVRAAVGDRRATVADWHVDPIGYVSGEQTTAGTLRCSGTAATPSPDATSTVPMRHCSSPLIRWRGGRSNSWRGSSGRRIRPRHR